MLCSINTLRHTAYEGIFKSIKLYIPTRNKHLIWLQAPNNFVLYDVSCCWTFFRVIITHLTRQNVHSMTAIFRTILDLETNIALKRSSLDLSRQIYHLHFIVTMISYVFLDLLLRCILPYFFLVFKLNCWLAYIKLRKSRSKRHQLVFHKPQGWIGCLVNFKDLKSSVGNPMSWILSHSKEKQSFLVVTRGIHGKCDHCIRVYAGNIFNLIGESSMKLSTKNLEEALRENVNSIALCTTLYPNSCCCIKVSKCFVTYQECQKIVQLNSQKKNDCP